CGWWGGGSRWVVVLGGVVGADDVARVVAGVGVGAQGLGRAAVPGIGDVVAVGLAATALGDHDEVAAGLTAEHAHDDRLAGLEVGVEGLPAEVGANTALDAAGGAGGGRGPRDWGGAGGP